MPIANTSRIADIMVANTGKWPNAGQGVLSGVMAGRQEARQNQAMQMQREQFDMEKRKQEMEMKFGAAMRPVMAQAFGVDEASIPDGMDMDTFKNLYGIYSTMSEAERANTARRASEMSQGLAAFDMNVPEGQRAQAWPAYRANFLQDFPELGKRLPEVYDAAAIGQMKYESEFGQKLMLKQHTKSLVNIEEGAFNPNATEFQTVYQKKSEEAEAKSDSEFYASVNQGVRAASEADYRAARMEANINQGLETNAAAPVIYAMKAWGNALLGEGTFENVGSAQELERLALDAAMQELQSFMGPTTDFEFGVALKKVGNLGTDPEAFRRYIQLVRRTGQRDREISQLVEAYKKQNGGSLRGVQGYISQWIANNPLVATMPQGVDPHEWIQTVKPGALFVNPANGKFLIKRQ